MTTESAMYAKVRDFVVTHWRAAEALTRHDSGPQARGSGISLTFGGIKVEPDVYGIVVSNSTELPLMGEGKLRMGGHVGTQAFAQALTYRNLGMLSFLFFPEGEFKTEAATTMRALCSQAGIGLLRVPAGKRPIDPERDIIIDLAGGEPNSVVAAVEHTLTEIKGVGQRHLAHIYPTSLRDLLSLIGGDAVGGQQLKTLFRRKWRAFASVFRQRPYDPMVAHKVASGTARVKDEYFEKLVGGLLALGLVAPTAGGYRATAFGEHLRSVITEDELFTTVLSPHVRRLFAFALMREFEEIVLLGLRTLKSAGGPVSTREYCLHRACGEGNWRLNWATPSGALRCPSCGGRSVEPGLQTRLHRESDDSGLAMTYPFVKFARAVGLFETRHPHEWHAQFPHLPTHRPAGQKITWKFLWHGDALAG
ncbi:MAG: hypothetical protein HYV09_24765 [Deltaproteobacteria bacterium]|nr:hypothetical protein [Deltaproteobacteria bacterium]